MDYYGKNLVQVALENEEYGPVVVYKDPSSRIEVTVMSVEEGESVPRSGDYEIHKFLTQFIAVVAGSGTIIIQEGEEDVPRELNTGDVYIIPSSTPHFIMSQGTTPLKFYSIYSKDTGDEWEH